MKAEKPKCPLCNGELEYRELKTEDGSMRICKVYVCLNKKCEKIYFDYEIEEGGSGEVDVAKAEREAVAAGYKKVSLKEKPSDADKPKNITADWESYEEGYEQAERDFNTRIVSRIRELEAELEILELDGWRSLKQCVVEGNLEVLRGLLEKKGVLYIRPAPGTCCPEMNIKKGVCLGCGTKKKKPEKT